MKRKFWANLVGLFLLFFVLRRRSAVRRRLESGLVSASTWAFVREARRTSGYSLFDLLHGYVYARWPYLYIGIGTGEHWIARRLGPILGRLIPSNLSDGDTWADDYHGKVVPLEAATRLVTVQEDISLVNLESIVPYARARDIVLQHPDHIVVLECPCRAARANPCEPLDVCLIVGEPFASFVVEHHAERSRWIAPEEAIEILQAEDERGHVHHAFFKDAMLDRFFAICNCCSCCCGAMNAHRNGTPMLASSGYISQVDLSLCAGCGVCADTCQFGALTVDDGVVVVDVEACMGCGVCVSQCATEALSLVRDLSRGEPLEIYELMARASVETQIEAGGR